MCPENGVKKAIFFSEKLQPNYKHEKTTSKLSGQ